MPKTVTPIKFLSTLSLRRATFKISKNLTDRSHFYPRSPCGERQRAENHANSQQEFLSTLSLRRATRPRRLKSRRCVFLSTLSLRRATVEEVSGDTWARDFYPRSPCGERRFQFWLLRFRFSISIHALLAESDYSRRF